MMSTVRRGALVDISGYPASEAPPFAEPVVELEPEAGGGCEPVPPPDAPEPAELEPAGATVLLEAVVPADPPEVAGVEPVAEVLWLPVVDWVPVTVPAVVATPPVPVAVPVVVEEVVVAGVAVPEPVVVPVLRTPIALWLAAATVLLASARRSAAMPLRNVVGDGALIARIAARTWLPTAPCTKWMSIGPGMTMPIAAASCWMRWLSESADTSERRSALLLWSVVACWSSRPTLEPSFSTSTRSPTIVTNTAPSSGIQARPRTMRSSRGA